MMAETSKRNSVAGKVATPKTAAPPTPTPTTAPQPIPDSLETLSKSIGARVRITTVAPLNQTHEGTVFTADPLSNTVVINTRIPKTGTTSNASTQPGDYRMINVSAIQSFQVLSLAPGTEGGDGSFATAQPPIGPVDIKRLKERERARIDQLKEAERNRGRGVTKEAQAIFDSFKRINMPIRWHNQEMVVHEAVIIASPYRPEDCKGAKDKQEVLNRVKKVLEGERKKLRDKEEKERKAVTPTGPRKGG